MSSRKPKTAIKADACHPRPVNSRWVRCPRSPCLVSFNPRSASRHASACRYFRCPNQYCKYHGTQSEVGDHESSCPHGLASEEIGTTDPLSESASEVLDILTSPNRLHSYPTDTSSAYCSESSPRKCTSSSQSQRLQSARFKSSKLSLAPDASNYPDPIPSSSSINRHDPGASRPTLDPYHPSAQRVFSLPAEAINPSLRPAPAPASKCSSPSPPPPPTRRLSTYDLQRYRPEPQSTRAGSSHSTQRSPPNDKATAASAHTTALYEALKKCYQSLLYTYDDYIYLVSQKVTQLDIPEEIVGPAVDDFRQAYHCFLANEIPDLSFLNELDCNAHEEGLGNSVLNAANDDQELSETTPEEENLTADQLSDQVRVKIAERKRRSPSGMDSPSNLFSRKRQRNDCALSQSASSPNSQRPTQFMRKLADTTRELTDEIDTNLPSRCNFKKVLDDAQHKLNQKVLSRKT